VEVRQRPLQLHMGLVGSADEADRTGPGSELRGGLLFGPHDLRVQAQAQVGVGVHAEELGVPLALQQEAGSPVSLGGADAGDDALRPLGGTGLVEVGDVVVQNGAQSMDGHGVGR